MLESILIKNFQVHKYLKVNLDPYVTVIVGPNDAGKSAILRALRWAMLNDPVSGDIRWGAKFSKVDLVVDGKKITRKRTKRGNIYLLNRKEFVAFRTNVPAEIQQLLNVTDLNFQLQLDPHFWLSLPAPQVGREMNQIINLGIIDTSLANITKKSRKANTTLEIIKARLKDARKQKELLAWVSDANYQLEQLELNQQFLQAKQANLIALQSLIGQVKIARSVQRRLAEVSIEGQFLLEKEQTLIGLIQQADLLRNLIPTTIKTRWLSKLAIPDSKLFEKYQTLKSLLSQIKQEKTKCHLIRNEMKGSLGILQKVKKCPLCKTPLLQLPHPICT